MTKFEQIFLQNWDIKVSVKNVQISLQEYLNHLSISNSEREQQCHPWHSSHSDLL